MVVLGIFGAVAALGGLLFYKPLRRKMNGIIGVGGSYVILIGIMLLVMLIQQLVSGKKTAVNTAQVVSTIVIMVLGLGYMVYVMLVRCETVGQRILLPFAACWIGTGFIWRIFGAIIFRTPLDSGVSNKKSIFPPSLISPDGEIYSLMADNGDNARYRGDKSGNEVYFYESHFEDGVPNGWSLR